MEGIDLSLYKRYLYVTYTHQSIALLLTCDISNGWMTILLWIRICIRQLQQQWQHFPLFLLLDLTTWRSTRNYPGTFCSHLLTCADTASVYMILMKHRPTIIMNAHKRTIIKTDSEVRTGNVKITSCNNSVVYILAHSKYVYYVNDTSNNSL